MVAQGMNNGDGWSALKLLKRFKSEIGNSDMKNYAIWNGAMEGTSGTNDVFTTYGRTYARRNKAKTVSENKCSDVHIKLGEATNKLNDSASKQALNMVGGDNDHEKVVKENLADCPQSQWRNFVLEQICHSLSSHEAGIHLRVQDGISSGFGKDCVTIKKKFDGHHKESQKHTPHSALVSNEFPKEANVEQSFQISNKCTFTDKCQRALLSVVVSQKFTSLCKLLFENFQGTKTPRVFDFGVINMRMKEGVYENSPMLFSSDIQQIWRKLESVGTELISLATSLSDLSKSAYHEQVGVPERGTVENGNHETSVWECNSHTKAEENENSSFYQLSSCQHCGEKAHSADSLVCDSCEEMYHVSCLAPAVSEIPLKSWYCARCTSCGIRPPHDNCAVCARLNAPKRITNGVGEMTPSNGHLRCHEEGNSNCSTDNELSKESKTDLCKICGNEVENGDEFRTCSHPFCPNKCYHTRCLSSKQLKSYGSRWYCPSCLCRVCFIDQDDDKIVLCDGCDRAYHIYCLQPPCTSIPRGNWFCKKCEAGIQVIRKAKKRPYENIGSHKKRGNKVRVAHANIEQKLRNKGDSESDKGRGGMDMLLTAAKTLNYEENVAAVH